MFICSFTIETSLNTPVARNWRIMASASSILRKSPTRHSQRGELKEV